ncbi:MAG: Histidine kinase [Parcubacteria group bacterium GW2011_GWC2_45_7]|nr:MAG: Histidine kinase [Parcubacteria group bacterium GW2011_GWC2_45_7]
MAFYNPTKLFTNLKLPYKFLTIALVFIIPRFFMLFFMTQSSSGYINFATWETYGVAYQRPLEELLRYIPQHEYLIRHSLENDERVTEQIVDIEAKIDKGIGDLEIINDKVGKQLQFTDEGLSKRKRDHFRVENVKAEWEGLKKNYSGLTGDGSDEQHQHLVSDIRTMITHCGDTSNLILDPDLDSYYLMDTTLLILPASQDRLSDILRDGERILKDGVLTQAERQQFLINAVQLKESDLSHILSDAVAYLIEDNNFYGISPSLQKNIPPALQTYRQTMEKFIDLMTHIANSETMDPSFKEDFMSNGFKASEESFRLWDIAADELEALLVKRINHYDQIRFHTLFWALFSLMVAILLMVIIVKSILNPVRELLSVIDTVSKGDLMKQVDIQEDRHDEISELSRAFNAMINNLKNVTASREELNRTYEELKQTQGQLLQSEKLASIGQLAAGVAHEINNPVGFISNNMEMLGQYITDYSKVLRMVDNLKGAIEQENWEKSKSIVQDMAKFEEEIQLDYIINDINNLLQHNQRGIERIQKIVLDLRTFARDDKDTMDLVKIEEVIDSILSIVHNEIKYKAELKKNYGETPLIKCNSQRLGQVFINILVNAGQAIHEKGTIEVKTYTKGKFVCVDIIDSGKGIPEENLKKVFDAFFTTKPVGQGTGLGLSVSYEIVKKHGGDILVKSKEGEGTTFTVMLPVT